ncbi:hypothetical protein PVK06_009168 [Gossypium arboreum]|uniref:Retrotransposon gag domain-containing protein n=1 Tax=Gossypium arboreum TaxID=29729 RepID=A0ABR0QN51_GOSAR|nr:hypothetical protein PVK06_009168 [Gossypium arboreum]
MDKVRTVMLHLEGQALDWYHLYSQRHRGLHMLKWSCNAHSLNECFGSSIFWDIMVELVTLKQKGSVDHFSDQFVSLLTQLQLTESYALRLQGLHTMRFNVSIGTVKAIFVVDSGSTDNL